MDPLTAFRSEAETLLAAALARFGHDGPAPSLEEPPDPAMGDLGMPCFPLAKALRRAPADIAKDVAAAVEPSGGGWVVAAEAHGPYVNLRMDRRRLAVEVLADPDAAVAAPASGQRVLLEHTSANPNGPLHVGRARNPIVGDTLVRLHRAAGNDVEAQYYMDNLGRQVALLYWGRCNLPDEALEPAARDKTDHALVRYYQAASDRMKADPAVAAEVQALVTRLEGAEPELLAEVRTVYESCFAGMRQTLERLGVRYDSVKDESDLVQDGSVDSVVERLKASPRAAQEEDGAWYLDLSDRLKGQKDRFYFTRKDGTSVYATRDVAYHAWKAQQAAPGGRMVNVLGEDHRLQALQVSVALEELGLSRPHVVFYSFVALPDGKMSTRAGRVVFLDDLMDEAVRRARAAVAERRGHELDDARLDAIAEAVGIAAVRYNIARIQVEKPIEFRWEDALDFDGDSAPYIMYAYARACSLMEKAAGTVARVDGGRIGAGEARLARAVAGYLPAVRDAVAANAPHRFAAYAVGLAAAFNEYYRDHPVLQCEDPEQQAVRLAAVAAARRALRASLDALGLPALESM